MINFEGNEHLNSLLSRYRSGNELGNQSTVAPGSPIAMSSVSKQRAMDRHFATTGFQQNLAQISPMGTPRMSMAVVAQAQAQAPTPPALPQAQAQLLQQAQTEQGLQSTRQPPLLQQTQGQSLPQQPLLQQALSQQPLLQQAPGQQQGMAPAPPMPLPQQAQAPSPATGQAPQMVMNQGGSQSMDMTAFANVLTAGFGRTMAEFKESLETRMTNLERLNQ